ncbi:uncharacterized protein NdufV3 [Planococcus citri]|uniref:uncharacterized protein NdufV3 n=1 Tax=Planococcus citri TaxID=170843 RepID=UPI0031F9D5CA
MSMIKQLTRIPRCELTTKSYRFFSSEAGSSSPSTSVSRDVPGLSSKVLKVPSAEVGPGASKSAKYKNPEYFSYHETSYFDAELEMLKFRLPQPSNKSK